jgi:hypothetical protein
MIRYIRMTLESGESICGRYFPRFWKTGRF